MRPKRATITDDRGKVMQRFTLRDQGVSAAELRGDPELAEFAGRLALAQSGMAGGRITGVQIAAAMTGFVGALAYTAGASLIPAAPAWMLMVLATGSAVVYLRVVFQFARKRGITRLVETCLAEGRCGCCLYKLAGTPPESDGIVQCPECGAAWFSRRIGILKGRASAAAANPNASPWLRAWRQPPPVIEDDRGRFVRLVDVRTKALSAILGDSTGTSVAKKLRSVYFRRGLFGALAITLLLIPSFTATMYILPARVASGIAASLVRVAAMVLALLYAWMMTAMAWRAVTGRSQHTGRKVARKLVSLGYCAACATPLDLAPAEEDGCVVCTQCGAAWKPVLDPALVADGDRAHGKAAPPLPGPRRDGVGESE